VTVSSSDFYLFVPASWDGPDTRFDEELDKGRLSALIVGAEDGVSDVDMALALMDLVRDDLQLSGTGGGERIRDQDMRIAVRALERTVARAGHEFQLPFRDHSGWRSYWIRKGASGSGGWQARRDLLAELFDQPYASLLAQADSDLDSHLAEPVSPHDRLGWPVIDQEISELRRHFRSASTPQDYRALGNDCVHITEALSRQVYDHRRHGSADEEPPVAQTKLRLERYVESSLPGSENAQLRKFARATIELAQAVKHRPTPTRTESGLLADAVILLANMLRRIGDDQ
jgi:hypothetical protein